MKVKDTIATVFQRLKQLFPDQLMTEIGVKAMIMDELDARFTYSLEEADLEKRTIFKGIDFRENYVRLKVGQKTYDEVLQNIETDLLSQAILEVEDLV